MEYNHLITTLRERRGWSDEFLYDLNNPHHDMLMSMSDMIKALRRIHKKQSHLIVLPDFDMDGITSAVIGYAGFSELGFNVSLYRPTYTRGHGVTITDIDEIMNRFPTAEAIITCDVGINDHEGIDYAKSKGLEVLVTDHHKEGPSRTKADVIVNPARFDETYALTGICGAHVLYQVVHTYARVAQPHKRETIELLRLFAGIGTVADVMPMLKENRKLTKDSYFIARMLYADPEIHQVEDAPLLKILKVENHHPVFYSAFEGMAVALREFALKGKLRMADDIDAMFYGFYLAPAFNAIRRTEAELDDAFEVFFGTNKYAPMERIFENNEKRKQLVACLTEEIRTSERPYAPFIYLTHATSGMMGLLANTLMRISGLPTVVLGYPGSRNEKGGSARSPEWYPLNSRVNGLCERAEAIGHENACGVRVQSIEDIPHLAAFLEEDSTLVFQELMASGTLSELESSDLTFGTTPDVDGDIDDTDSIFELIAFIESMKPFGEAIPEPVMGIKTDLKSCRFDLLPRAREGEDIEQKHLRITLPNGMKCLWWNHAHMLERLSADGASKATIQGRFEINTFMGNTSIDLIVTDVLLDHEE